MIDSAQPVRIATGKVSLEKNLEGWIEGDPSLVAQGLQVVGRQVPLEGGRLDLLGVDPQGRWVLVEIKRSTLYRDALVQVLDYAASIASMPNAKLREVVHGYLEKRGEELAGHPVESVLAASGDDEAHDVAVVVVGTGRDGGLERLAGFLGQNYGVPIQVVTFEVFDVGGERQILIREVTEADSGPSDGAAPVSERTVEAVFARAELRNGLERFKLLYDAGTRNGLYARPSKYSIMYAPPSNKTRMLFTAWVRSNDGQIVIFVSPDAFAEFFSVTSEEAAELLGPEGYLEVPTADDAAKFGFALDTLMERARARGEAN
jgi:Holliday junction resolvase-like predicted endonuclease